MRDRFLDYHQVLEFRLLGMMTVLGLFALGCAHWHTDCARAADTSSGTHRTAFRYGNGARSERFRRARPGGLRAI